MDVHRCLHGGTELTVSVATPAHAPAIVVLYASLSEHSQRLRFGGGMSFDDLAAAAALDAGTGTIAVVASEGARVVAEARCQPVGERVHWLVVTVADDYQGQGLGTHLVDRLREEAAQRGVRVIRAVVPADNVAALRLMHSCGATLVSSVGDRGLVLEVSCGGTSVPGWRSPSTPGEGELAMSRVAGPP